MTPAQRRSTAYHEASHCYASWLLRGHDSVLRASIVPDTERLGITYLARAPISLAGHTPGVLRADPALRLAIERVLIGLMAGDEGARLAAEEAGYDDQPEEVEQIVATLPPLAVDLVLDPYVIEPEPVGSDEARIAELAEGFAAEAERTAYLQFLRAATGDLVIRGWAPISRLAAALLERSTIPGDELAGIFEGGAANAR